jgi:Domain of unknown function (DUF4365)
VDLNSQKERFSDAYVHAVAAVAGCDLMKPPTDIDSIDWVVHAQGLATPIRAPRIELQLKATSLDVVEPDFVRYPLKIKNYDDLRPDNVLVPRILVVVVLPGDDLAGWLEQSEAQLIMRRCGYWLSLRGMALTENVATVTVSLPRAQVFSPASLGELMSRVGQNGRL